MAITGPSTAYLTVSLGFAPYPTITIALCLSVPATNTGGSGPIACLVLSPSFPYAFNLHSARTVPNTSAAIAQSITGETIDASTIGTVSNTRWHHLLATYNDT